MFSGLAKKFFFQQKGMFFNAFCFQCAKSVFEGSFRVAANF